MTEVLQDRGGDTLLYCILNFIYLLFGMTFTIMVTVQNVSEGARQFTETSSERIETVSIIV